MTPGPGKIRLLSACLLLGLKTMVAQDADQPRLAGLLLPPPDEVSVTTEILTSIEEPVSGAPLPARAKSLRDNGIPAPGLQVGSSCSGWVAGYAILTMFHSQLGRSIPPRSPYFVYRMAREKDYPGSPLDDNGCTLRTALKVITEYGSCHFGAFRKLGDAVTPEILSEAKKYSFPFQSDLRRVQLDNLDQEKVAALITNIKAKILEDLPVPAGFNVPCHTLHKNSRDENNSDFTSAKDVEGRPIRVWSRTSDHPSTLSNHAMLIIGYDDDAKALLVMNSWGGDFGNEGYFWISYDHFGKSCTHLYLFRESRAALIRNYQKKEAEILAGVSEGSIPGYVRIASSVPGREPTVTNFDIPGSGTPESIARGDILTASKVKGYTCVNIRGGPPVCEPDKTKLDGWVGQLNPGDRFHVVEVQKITTQDESRTEYWAKGYVEQP